MNTDKHQHPFDEWFKGYDDASPGLLSRTEALAIWNELLNAAILQDGVEIRGKECPFPGFVDHWFGGQGI